MAKSKGKSAASIPEGMRPDSSPKPRKVVSVGEQNYTILHTFVGPFPKGHVVNGQELVDSGADLGRLLSLEAIEETSEGESKAPLPETLEREHVRPTGLVDPQGVTGGEEVEEVPEEAPEGEIEEGQDPSSMTVAQLRAMAKGQGVRGYTAMDREELIQAVSQDE